MYTSLRKSITGRLRTNTSIALSVQSVNNLLNLNMEKPSAPNVGGLMDDPIKVAEAAQKRIDEGKASNEHRERRARDSYKCYLVYKKMREEERCQN